MAIKILIDIGHPSHVHYFKNLIKIMSEKGHQVIVIARDRDIINYLLKYYEILFHTRGKGKNSILGKFVYMIYADFLIYKKSLKYKPNLILSFSSPYAAQVSKLLKIPHITLNDTEHTDKYHKIFTYPFSEAIINPFSYQNNLGVKQIRIKCFIEYFYLHPKVYKPDPEIFNILGINNKEKYVVLRFVSWNAFHDINKKGLSLNQKIKLVTLLNKKYKVYISSENEIEPELQKYKIRIPPERMHDLLAYSSLFIGESGTMASESTLLGVPSVYINPLPLMCYLKTAQEYGILKYFKKGEGLNEYISNLVNSEYLKNDTINKRDKMVKDFINPTELLVWFLEEWPDSKYIIKDNPNYQVRFK